MRLLAFLLAASLLSPQKLTRWQDPFEVLPVPKEAGQMTAMLQGRDSAVWQDGDVLTFLHKDSSDAVRLSGGIQMPMKKIEGSDLWIVQLKMKDWEKAFVSYTFMSPNTPPGTRIKQSEWRGAKAPPKPQKVAKKEDLKGKLIQRIINSPNLGEERAISVYLPPNAPKAGLPAFFMADGGACDAFAMLLEPLILSGKVRPVAIIGAYSGTYKGAPGKYEPEKDYRALEYIPNYSRYDKHMAFFTEEVTAFATKEYGISSKREDRAVFGFSNGGAFAAGVAVRRPEVFGTSIPMSLGMVPTDEKPSQPLPKLYFLAGTLESFSRPTKEYYEKVKGWGADADLNLYVAGHDFEMWQLAFAELAPKVFPPK
jgi:enterochelin esterase-like enzyme